MRKLNLILTALAVMLGTALLNAQSSTGVVTLNVKLNPIQTLLVNPSQNTVDLEYYTVADYEQGVTSTQNDHLTIYSTGGFQVKVKSAGSQLLTNTPGPAGNINANTIQILPSAGSDVLNGVSYTPDYLSAEDRTIIASTTGGVDKKFNIEYKGAGADAYLNHYVAGQNPTIYTTQVTYTIVAQ